MRRPCSVLDGRRDDIGTEAALSMATAATRRPTCRRWGLAWPHSLLAGEQVVVLAGVGRFGGGNTGEINPYLFVVQYATRLYLVCVNTLFGG